MAFDTQTRTVFAAGGPEEQIALIGRENFMEMNEARTQWLQTATEDEKTDNIATEDGIRNWNSTASAEEFKSFLEGLASNYGLEATVTIL